MSSEPSNRASNSLEQTPAQSSNTLEDGHSITTQLASTSLNEDMSANPSSEEHALQTSNEKSNIALVNRELIRIGISFSMRKVIEWGCTDKDPALSYKQFLKKKKLSNSILKETYNFDSRELKKLSENKTCSSFDVTLLYKLIRVACRDLASADDDIWNGDEEDRLECLLRKLKEFRNGDAHDSLSLNSTSLTKEITDTIEKVLLKAGNKYDIITSEVETQWCNVKDITSNLQNKLITPDIVKRTNNDIMQILREKGYYESKEKMIKVCSRISLPFVRTGSTSSEYSLATVYHPMKLQQRKYLDQTGKWFQEFDFSYTDILQRCHEQNIKSCVMIVNGDAGSGKTTLAKVIVMDYFDEADSKIKDINDFDLLIYFECRDNSIESLNELIKRTYHKTLIDVEDGDAKDAVLSLKTLYVVEGLDEYNIYAFRVLRGIIEHLKKGNAALICTSRPYASSKLKDELTDSDCRYTECKIREIKEFEEQDDFIKRYKRVMNSDANDIVDEERDVIFYFRQVQQNLYQHFIYPINMVLFCFLFVYSPAKNLDWSNPYHLYKNYLEIHKQKAVRRASETCTKNTELNVDKVIGVICEHALSCLQKNKIIISKHEYETLKIECHKKAEDVPIDDILSEFFQEIQQCAFPVVCTYQYHHKHIMDYFASRSLLRKFIEAEENGLAFSIKKTTPAPPSFLDNMFSSASEFALMQLFEECSEEVIREVAPKIFDLSWHARYSLPFTERRVLAGCKYDRVMYDLINDKININGYYALHNNEIIVNLRCGNEGLESKPCVPSTLLKECKWQPKSNRKDVKEFWFRLEYWHSKFEACDEILKACYDKSYYKKFDTVVLKSCLEDGMGNLLSSAIDCRAFLNVALRKPANHTLGELSGKPLNFLEVSVEHPSKPPAKRRPLPQAQYLRLVLYRARKGAGQWVVKMVKQLAPADGDKRFDTIRLLECSLGVKEKQRTLGELSSLTSSPLYYTETTRVRNTVSNRTRRHWPRRQKGARYSKLQQESEDTV